MRSRYPDTDITKKRVAVALLLSTCVGLSLVGPAGAGDGQLEWLKRFTISGSVELGGLPQSVNSESSKLEEYRDLPGTLVIPTAEIYGIDKEQGYYFEIATEDVGQQDQQYLLRAGQVGGFEIEAGWDQIPHKLSNSARTLYRRSGNNLVLDDQMRDLIAADNALLPSILELARGHGLRLRDDTGWMSVRLTPLPFLTFKANYKAEHREGTRAKGTASAFSAGANIVELPAPFDYVTHTVGASAEYAKRGLLLRLRYHGSIFRNPDAALAWDNPLVTDDAPNAFSTGQLAREPDNQAHEIRLEGRARVRRRTTMSGSLAYGFRRQNDDLLPLTSNRALFDPRLPSLPTNKLDGRIDTIAVNYRLTSQPLDRVTLKGRYRFYDFDDRSRGRSFSDYVIADSLLAGSSRRGLRYSYSKQTMGAGASWNPISSVRAELNYDWVRWHRENRETRNTDENTIHTSLGVTPLSWLLVRAAYTHAIRDPGSYEAAVVERSFENGPSVEGATFALLRKYDLAHRQRDAVSVSAQATPCKRFALAASFELGADDYDRSSYGLLDDDDLSYSLDASYALPGGATVFANYTREDYRYNQRSRFRPIDNVDDVQFVVEDPDNDWRVRGHDSVDTVGVGGSVSVIPGKLDADISYNFSFGVGRLRASGAPGGEAAGEAENYPNVKNRLHQVALTFSYRMSNKLQARFGYAFERFTETDFATDEIAPSATSLDPDSAGSVFLAARAPDYTAHIGSISLKYEF